MRRFRFTFTAKLASDGYPAVKIRVPSKLTREYKLKAGEVVRVTVEGVGGWRV